MDDGSKRMKLNEVKLDRDEPAMMSIDWGEHTTIYGPFKNYNTANRFEDKLRGMIEEAGYEERDIQIFWIETHNMSDPQEAVEYLEKRIQSQ